MRRLSWPWARPRWKGRKQSNSTELLLKLALLAGDLRQVGMNTGGLASFLPLIRDVDPGKYHLRVTAKEQGQLRSREELQLKCGNSVNIGRITRWQTALVQVPVKCLFECLWTGVIGRLKKWPHEWFVQVPEKGFIMKSWIRTFVSEEQRRDYCNAEWTQHVSQAQLRLSFSVHWEYIRSGASILQQPHL